MAAGADIVGMEDLMKSMKDGDLNYDVVIGSPDAMGGVYGGVADVVIAEIYRISAGNYAIVADGKHSDF